MPLWLLRLVFATILIGLALSTLRDSQTAKQENVGLVAFGAILAVGVLTLAADLLTHKKQITTASSIYFGLLLGFILSSLISNWLEPIFLNPENVSTIAKIVMPPIRLLITLVCCYLTVSTLLQTKDAFRFIIPYVEFSPQAKGGRPLVLDTSVIIDGRIADICDTRIIDSKLVVPRFVLQELQAIADSSDKLKRNRGRRGLDMLKKMQNSDKVDLEVHEAKLPELRDIAKVDERLVVLAKALGGKVVTNDFNLNKIAQLQGVEVINLNELSNALKSVALPGEALMVRLVKPGDQMGQGVGYLEDGTMVVVEQGRSHIGQEIAINVKSVLQTPAGRMIFGQVGPQPPQEPKEGIQTAERGT